MRINFSKEAWQEYESWQREDPKLIKKINELLKEIMRTPFEGKGKPEPLKYQLAGF